MVGEKLVSAGTKRKTAKKKPIPTVLEKQASQTSVRYTGSGVEGHDGGRILMTP